MTQSDEWNRCKPWIEAALETSPGFETIADVARMVDEGKYQFWPSENCAAITEIATFSQRKVLTVVHGGGDLTELLDTLEPRMCDFAKRMGCDAIMGTGRKGWERVTASRGYRLAFINMIKEV